MVALRPDVTRAREPVPRGLLWRDIRWALAAGVLDLSAGAAVVATGTDTWHTSAAGTVLGIAGGQAIIEGFHEVHRRTRHAARLREHGPDAADTLLALQADRPLPRWALAVRVVYELLLTVLAVIALFHAWPEGAPGWALTAAVLTGRLAAAASHAHYVRRGRLWYRDFARLDGIALPPLPDRWRVIARPRSGSPSPGR
ncbi:hypothetical protein AB0I60_01815 [Actinosynnema sp. NPDC050436]|uniref:hypothetical protein n=1 Tax=Actinosynnema sp. NPDC050436 TaxID=3155659 RepID=UPI0033DA40FD